MEKFMIKVSTVALMIAISALFAEGIYYILVYIGLLG